MLVRVEREEEVGGAREQDLAMSRRPLGKSLSQGPITSSHGPTSSHGRVTSFHGPATASLGPALSQGPSPLALAGPLPRRPARVSGAGAGHLPRSPEDKGLHHRVRPAPSPIFSISDKVPPTVAPEGPVFPGRPKAPARPQPGGHSPGAGQVMNSLSLGNWLHSLPDTSRGEEVGRGAGEEQGGGLENVGRGAKEVELDDLDDQESGGCIERPASGRVGLVSPGRPLTLQQAAALKALMFGEHGHQFTPGWLGQAFTFGPTAGLLYGLVQAGGGPCGVLAAVQARTLKVLIFGSKLFTILAAARPLAPSQVSGTLASR